MDINEKLQAMFRDLRQEILVPQTLGDEEEQLRIDFLLRLLPIIFIVVALLLLTRIFFIKDITPQTYSIFAAALATVFAIYLTAKTRRYQLTINTLYILGTAMMIVNAATSPPPHFQVTYLLILPFITAMLLSLRETIFWSVFIYVAFVGFGIFLILPISRSMFTDLTQQSFLFTIFILFAAYQRNRLEKDRQQLAIEKNRAELLQFLLRSISHDFRTPLSVINSSTYLLGRSISDEKQLAQLEKITRQTGRLDDMMRDISTLTQLEYNFTESLNPVNLQQIAKHTIGNFLRIVEDKGITINTEFVEGDPTVMATYDGLVRIVTHLVDNAIQYTPENGVIWLRVMVTEEYISLEVEDTGIGIAEDDLEHIFEPFFRADKARSTYGSGLGLALVKKTVELFQGTITSSSVVNEGTRFSVSFPRNRDENAKKSKKDHR